MILISSLSLVGYVLTRLLGPSRGVALTGLTGGLASSTAVTLSFAKEGREKPEIAKALACGILLAWAVMGGNLLGREVLAEDVAQAFVALAKARKTTGHIEAVDGGNIAAALR